MEQPPEFTAEVVRPWDRPVVLIPVFALIALVGGVFPSFSLEANLYVFAVGAVLVWLGLSGRVPRRSVPARLGRGGLWWLVPVAVLIATELVDFLLGSSYAHPTLSLLADPMLEGYFARSIAYFLWLGGFWGLVRR